MIEGDLILFTVLVVIATLALIYVGELRPDAYLAIAILIYFIYTSVNYSFRFRVKLKVVDLLLITTFSLIVAYRVYEVLK
ncbi:MAG: hypothetical protein QXH99_07260 [Sulfolobales archaeon]